MELDSHSMPLYWESTYAIVLHLMERYPDVDVESVGIAQLYQWVVALPGFADDLKPINENALNDILRTWYEEISNL